MTETKRDVFEGLLESYMYSADIVIDEISTDGVADRLNLGNIIASTRDRYDAALPDDLPVIPKEVSEYIRKAKAPGKWGLLDVFWHLGDNISAVGINGLYDWQRWMADNQVAVVRAWLLESWIVEENGEIVKLEAER